MCIIRDWSKRDVRINIWVDISSLFVGVFDICNGGTVNGYNMHIHRGIGSGFLGSRVMTLVVRLHQGVKTLWF